MTTLYEAVLGASLAALPPSLRRFHSDPRGGRARGTLRVLRGRNLFARLLGWAMGLPPESPGATVVLRVDVDEGVERWLRTFDGHPMVTRQWAEGPHLVEAVGPTRVVFRLGVSAGTMRFEPLRVRLLGLPLPRWLAPSVTASAGPPGDATDATAWALCVEVSAPVVGRLVRYEGTMALDAGAP